jgi:predicted kinase
MILSENVKLFDRNLRDGRGVTGEIDLLLVREDGSVAIVDIKTKALKEKSGKLVSGWKDFGNPNAKYESSTYFRAQQSIYGYQFYNSTGITPDLKLMPFDMKLSKEKIGYIEDIDLAPLVEDGQDTIDLEYLLEIENFGITKITPDIKAPIKKETSTSTNAKADVILPIGTSGSGKSTFIKSLPQENLVVISPDDMRVEFTGDINNKSKDKEIYIEAAKRAIKAVKDGKQVVFDTTNLTKEKRRPFIEAIKKAIPNANIQYKLMELNPELAKQRIKAQIARGENRANVSDETIDRHAESYKQMLEDIKSEGITNYDTKTTGNIGIQESDPTKNRIGENVNKPVIYNGRVGKLVLMPSAEFGVEIVINDDISALQLTLDALEANLSIEKGEFGNEEYIQELEENIKRISTAIESATGITQVFPIQIAGKNVSNGLLKLSDAGVSMITPTDLVGQVSAVNGQVINASFSNKDESIATINGVKYEVLRDTTGSIKVLSYLSNDKEISQIDKQIGNLSTKIGNLRNSLSTEEIESDKKDAVITSIAKLQEQIKQLANRRTSLAQSNNKMFIYGQNANDYIFALNRLPNGVQRATKNATKANETQDLKSIQNLSLSRAIATTITEILSENYPEVLDTLIEEGVQAVKKADLTAITKWANETIQKLESLGYSVINRGDIVDDITNQINALNALLNDLASINLTKNGRISKKQETADQLFGPGFKEVSNRTSVPKNERTTGKPTKGVSRPATRTELEDIVKQAREENLGEVFGETEIVNEVNEAIDNINNATLDTIELVYQEEFLKIRASKDSDITDAALLNEAYKNRLLELKTIVSLQNVSKGEYLISKNPIFTDISGEEVIVVKKTKDSITLKNIKTEESRDFTEEELIDNFEKTTMEAREPEVPVEITPVDIEDSNESKDTIKALQNDADALNNAKVQSKASDKQSRLDKLGENSKLC